MANNQLYTGFRRTIIAAATILANALVDVGDQMGVAIGEATTGQELDVQLVGEFTYAKAAVDIARGDALYWDAGNAVLTNVAAGHLFVGFAIDDYDDEDDDDAVVQLAKFADGPGRTWTAAATGAQTVPAALFRSGRGVEILVPNTAGLTITFPELGDRPGIPILLRKSSADAAAVTPAAAAGESIIGTIGTIDANNDRTFLMSSANGLTHVVSVIA